MREVHQCDNIIHKSKFDIFIQLWAMIELS
jgi:hypothetical protein